MSVESAKAFYSRMTKDEAFRTQLEQAASKEERQQILQAGGYEFTQEEWEAVTAEIQASNSTNNELKDEELEAVAGGVFPITPVAAYGVVLPDDWLF